MKKGIEFSFAWLFSVIAGVIIIFLAIYLGYKMITTSEYEAGTIAAKELSIIFEPLETGLAAKKGAEASLTKETRIFNECSDIGAFGKQEIGLAFKKGFGFTSPGARIPVTNKYIFSENEVEGKKVYFFSMPFKFPFKIADIIVLTSKSYCFVNAPDFVQEDLENLALRNVKFDNCTSRDAKVCFGVSASDCLIRISSTDGYETGSISKQNKNLYFVGNLMYAGIFSSKEIYECNIKRLAKKGAQLGLLYKDEAKMISEKCAAVSDNSLAGFAIHLSNINSSADLIALNQIAKVLDDENSYAECALW